MTQSISFSKGTDVSLQIMMALSGRPKGERLLTILVGNGVVNKADMVEDTREAMRVIGRTISDRRGMRVNIIQMGGSVILETNVFARNHLERMITSRYQFVYSSYRPSFHTAWGLLHSGKDRNFFVPRQGENRWTPVVVIGGEFMREDFDPKYGISPKDTANIIHLSIPEIMS